MRALIVSTTTGFLETDARGGDTLARHELYQEHLQRLEPGSDLRVLVLRKDRSPLCAWRERGRLRVASVGISNPLAAGARLGVMLAAPPKSLFRAWRPDLVTSQSPFEDGLFSLLLARRLGARHLAQAHFRHEMIATDFRPAIRRILPPLVLRATDRVRFVGETQRREFLTAYRLDPARSFVTPVPMMVQAAGRSASAHAAGLRDQLCLSAGRLVASKRLDLWLEVAARVAEAVPEARFVIAGDGPARQSGISLAERLGLGRRVEFTGRLGPEQIADLYGRAAVFLSTSDTDAFGRVIAEAGAFATPVVSTACGGPEEIVTDGETGFLKPRGDVEGLASATIALLQDPALRARMGEAARQRVHDLYDADALASRLMAQWVDLAHGGRR